MRPEFDAKAAIAEVPALMRYANTIVRDHALAEDLVQETLTRALERAGSFRGEASLSTWLHRILHNAAIDHVRRAREDPTEHIATLVERQWRDDTYTVDASVVAARAESLEELKDALLRLPLNNRTVVVLHDMENITVAEIARIQQIKLPAAKQRLRRGRMMLVSALARGAERRAALHGVPLSCWDARAQVSDYVDDNLDDRDRELLETHLGSCPTCPPLYAALVDVRDAVGALRDPDTVVPTDLVRRLIDSLRCS